MRVKNSIRNSAYAIGGQILSTVLSFISRTVFIYVLGATYLGVSGLFTNILLVFSFAELGIGNAIVYNLYKPLAEGNQDRVKSLMNFYKSAYNLIGFIVLFIGICLLPFLNLIIKEQLPIENLRLIYLLYIINSFSTYFFAHKRTLLLTDQKAYIDTFNRNMFFLIQSAAQIIYLLIFKNFIGYLIIQMLFGFLSNLSISKKVDALYPYLKQGRPVPLDKEELKGIFKQTSALIVHKVGSIVVEGTDNILISTFIGVYWVGLYSNYLMVINIIKLLISQVFTSLTASIGNLVALSDADKTKSVFDRLLLINFWVYGFSSVCLWVLLNPFISLWLGNEYIMDSMIVTVLILCFYVAGMRKVVSAYKETSGLFWNDRFRPIAESLVNLVISLVLVQKIGIAGVFVGTLVSHLTTTVWVEALIVYKHVFQKSIWEFYIKYILGFVLITSIALFVQYLCSLIKYTNYLGFAMKLTVCIVLTNLLLFAVFGWTNQFKQVAKSVMAVIYKRRKPKISN